MTEHSRQEVMWAIRDARGLDANEKAVLWCVESRGVVYGTAATVAADCGMALKRFYNWRRELIEKGLLKVTERPGTTTQYRVDAGAISQWGSSRTDREALVESTVRVSPIRPTEEEPEDHPEEDQEENPEEGSGKVTVTDAEVVPTPPCFFCEDDETCERCAPEEPNERPQACEFHPQFPAVDCYPCSIQPTSQGRPEWRQELWHNDALVGTDSVDESGTPPVHPGRLRPRYMSRMSV